MAWSQRKEQGLFHKPFLFSAAQLLICLLVLLLFPSTGTGQTSIAREQFYLQLTNSYSQDFRFTKEVEDLSTGGLAPQEKRIPSVSAYPDACLLEKELAYVFEVDYQNPYLTSLFLKEEIGDTVIVRLKPGSGRLASELRWQKFVYAPDGTTLRFVETQLEKRQWLYDFTITVRVFFNEKGHYDRHELWISNRIIFIGSKMKSRILGKAEYL
jgi:hypothetical protein